MRERARQLGSAREGRELKKSLQPTAVELAIETKAA